MSARLKILALVSEAFGGFGGIAQYNRDLIGALALADGVESVRVLPRLAGGAIEKLPRKVFQTDAVFSRRVYAAKAFGEALQRRPNLIFGGHLYMASLAHYVAKSVGAPFVVQLHGTEIWRAPSATQRRALEQADAVLCVSRHTRTQVLTFTSADPNRVVVIPNTFGADYCPGSREFMRRTLGLTDEFALLTVGRLDNREGYKGHDHVIAALAQLNPSRRIVYLIAGDGQDRARLEDVAAAAGVASRVRFLGYTPRDELPDLYRAADLFVMPSRGEGFGIVFLEAMASGTPALGLSVGGACDPLDFGEWGRAVTTKQLAKAIAEAIVLPRPDPIEMYDAVNARFGVGAFVRQVAAQVAGRFAPSAVAPSH
jgi:phosphatidyl-myo-inositol dimannoside synthase